MKHLDKNDFIGKLAFIGEGNIYGITICLVYEEFIRDLFRDGFSIREIVTIFNFLFYELGIDFKLKYHHIYYCIKRNNFKKNDIS